MTKLHVMIPVCFVAAFAAGATAGALWQRAANTPAVETLPVVDPVLPTQQVSVPAAPAEVPNNSGGRERPPQRTQWMVDLKLSDEQRVKMDAIWSDAMKKSWKLQHDDRDAVRKEKDAGLKALLTEQQKKDYDALLKATEAKYEDLNKQNTALHEEAVAKAKEMLSPEQCRKYDEIRKNREQQMRRGRPGPDWRTDGRQPGRPEGREGRNDGKKDGKQESKQETK